MVSKMTAAIFDFNFLTANHPSIWELTAGGNQILA
jgi:hypothetical protein